MGTLAKGIQYIGIDRCHHRRYFSSDGLFINPALFCHCERLKEELAKCSGKRRKKEKLEKRTSSCIYIMTNKHNGVLYTGVTDNLFRRVSEHKNKLIDGFTSKYNITKLVYYEEYPTMEKAIARENKSKVAQDKRRLT